MKLKYIDAIRGIAILLVIMVHTSHLGDNQYPFFVKSFFGFAAKGVQLFFIASAFTLFLSYNFREKTEDSVNRNFYIRRFFRIAPMYYIGIVYFIFQNDLSFQENTWNILSNIFFIHGISPHWINNLVPGGWSITVEMTFYIFLPLLAVKIKSLNKAISFTIVAYLISMIFRLFLQNNIMINNEDLWMQFSYYNFITQLPTFGIGIIAYFLIIKNDYTIHPLNLLILFFIFTGHFIWGIIIPNFLLIGVGFLILIYTLSIKEYALFVNKFTMYLGKISYSAYLVHFAILHWLERFEFVSFLQNDNFYTGILNYFILLAIVLAITSIISTFFYNYIEMPFQRMGKRLINKLVNKKTQTMLNMTK